MKKTTAQFLSLLLVSFLHTNVFAQGIDKPQYQIIAHRAGAYLGTFTIELFPLIAPLATQNFDSLVSVQFFDSTAFHRVVPGFVIQGGDPNSIHGPISTWGQGNPNQPNVPAEFSVVRHLRGILGAARDVDTNSANSQFYICVANSTFLDGQYTVYGQVTSGMSVVDTIVYSPRDANDVPLQKIEMFVTNTGVNNSIPNAPVLNVPADLSQGILNTQYFRWSTVSTAVMYTIEFSTDPLFSTIDHWRNAGDTSTTMPALQGSTTYYWRVRSNNGGHESVSSNVFSFTTTPGAANLLYPAHLATSVPNPPVLQWNTVAGATDYTLQVSKTALFIPTNFMFNQSGLLDTFQLVTGLLPNTSYWWRVRSANGTTQGFYSSVFKFTTAVSTDVNEIHVSEKNIVLNNVFPNPAENNLSVSITLKQPGIILFSLKNMDGKTVYKSSKKANTTSYMHTINVSKLKKGAYVLSAVLNDDEETMMVEVN